MICRRRRQAVFREKRRDNSLFTFHNLTSLIELNHQQSKGKVIECQNAALYKIFDTKTYKNSNTALHDEQFTAKFLIDLTPNDQVKRRQTPNQNIAKWQSYKQNCLKISAL